MTDDNKTPEKETETEDSQPTLEQLQAELQEWKKHSRTWEDRAKANSKAAEELEKIKTSQLSDLEKLQKRVQDAEAATESLRVENLRHQVAAEKGVPASLLRGSTEDELVSSAEGVLSYVREYAEKHKPTPANLNQGKNGPPPNQQEDGNQWLRNMARGRNP